MNWKFGLVRSSCGTELPLFPDVMDWFPSSSFLALSHEDTKEDIFVVNDNWIDDYEALGALTDLWNAFSKCCCLDRVM